jgi:hypothetical protein
MRMGSATGRQQYGMQMSAPVLESHPEDDGAEEEGVSAGCHAGGSGVVTVAQEPDQAEQQHGDACLDAGVEPADAAADAVDGVVRVALPGSQQQGDEQEARKCCCRDKVSGGSGQSAASFKESLSTLLSDLKERLLSPKNSAGRGVLAAAAADACAATPEAPPAAAAGTS